MSGQHSTSRKRCFIFPSFKSSNRLIKHSLCRITAANNASISSRLELFLKITANATAYGTLARFDRRDLATAAPIDVYGPDGHVPAEPTKTPEDPGPYCFPPIAASTMPSNVDGTDINGIPRI